MVSSRPLTGPTPRFLFVLFGSRLSAHSSGSVTEQALLGGTQREFIGGPRWRSSSHFPVSRQSRHRGDQTWFGCFVALDFRNAYELLQCIPMSFPSSSNPASSKGTGRGCISVAHLPRAVRLATEITLLPEFVRRPSKSVQDSTEGEENLHFLSFFRTKGVAHSCQAEQSGSRERQLHQTGVEFLNSEDPPKDAEVYTTVALVVQTWWELAIVVPLWYDTHTQPVQSGDLTTLDRKSTQFLCLGWHFRRSAKEHRSEEQSSQARHDHKSACERIERDQHVFVVPGTPPSFLPSLLLPPPRREYASVRSAYDGYATSETDGFLELFFKGLFFKSVFCATSTSTSIGT